MPEVCGRVWCSMRERWNVFHVPQSTSCYKLYHLMIGLTKRVGVHDLWLSPILNARYAEADAEFVKDTAYTGMNEYAHVIINNQTRFSKDTTLSFC